MFNGYSPFNLAKSIRDILINIHKYIEEVVNSNFKIGLCVINPKRIGVKPPSKEISDKIKEKAKEHFKENNVQKIKVKYFIPPNLPEVKKMNNKISKIID